MDQQAKAAAFRQMHREPPILVLPNAWDVASARAFAQVKGVRAIATTSAAVARSLGWDDGEKAPAGEMLETAKRIAAAVDLPVTADLEHGYGDPVGTARAAWDAGIVGINFEDSSRGGLLPLDEQVAAIKEIRAAVPDLVLNARVDIFVRIGGDVAEAVERANAYLAAGADCAYPILCPPDSIPELARRIDGPINVVVQKGVPGPDELEELGVARLTWGGGLAAIAYEEATRIVKLTVSA
jgi:2-methylisocitrate lyase-like PEP mutase family enzyme